MTEAEDGKQRYAYIRLDGSRGKTIFTPHMQLEISKRTMAGESINSIALDLGVAHETVTRFVTSTGIFEKQAELMNQLLAEQYLELRKNQLAVAQEYINRARAIGQELFILAETTLKSWQEKSPKSMTVGGLAKLLHQWRAVEDAWVGAVGLPVGVKKHYVKIDKTETPSREPITIAALIERGIDPSQIDALIAITEQFQTPKALPSGERDIERDTAPGSDPDEGGLGVGALQEEPGVSRLD